MFGRLPEMAELQTESNPEIYRRLPLNIHRRANQHVRKLPKEGMKPSLRTGSQVPTLTQDHLAPCPPIRLESFVTRQVLRAQLRRAFFSGMGPLTPHSRAQHIFKQDLKRSNGSKKLNAFWGELKNISR